MTTKTSLFIARAAFAAFYLYIWLNVIRRRKTHESADADAVGRRHRL